MAQDRDRILARLAVERGYLTDERVTEALEAQRRALEQMGLHHPLLQVLLGKGLLTPDQAQDLENAVAVATGEDRLIAGYEVVSNAWGLFDMHGNVYGGRTKTRSVHAKTYPSPPPISGS